MVEDLAGALRQARALISQIRFAEVVPLLQSAVSQAPDSR